MLAIAILALISCLISWTSDHRDLFSLSIGVIAWWEISKPFAIIFLIIGVMQWIHSIIKD